MPGRFRQSETRRATNTVKLPPKTDFYRHSHPLLVGERASSCHYRLWNSRKIFTKVTNVLFPNKINGISALALARRPLIRRGEQVFSAIFPPDAFAAEIIYASARHRQMMPSWTMRSMAFMYSTAV
jgi:hypothetical protein